MRHRSRREFWQCNRLPCRTIDRSCSASIHTHCSYVGFRTGTRSLASLDLATHDPAVPSTAHLAGVDEHPHFSVFTVNPTPCSATSCVLRGARAAAQVLRVTDNFQVTATYPGSQLPTYAAGYEPLLASERGQNIYASCSYYYQSPFLPISKPVTSASFLA